ncbi:MAG: hypothetical protein Q9209_004117 [Squamulea sp. 1 TL-2023]
MNNSSLRRLRADRKDLYKRGLPPNYLFPPDDSSAELTNLDVFLVGPEDTPYFEGLWKLQLLIPNEYPRKPPEATFRTRIWHPNVDECSGNVCVDTLKRDWKPSLTLREILLTISCLLIHPNPDSALNSTAGRLLQEDYALFARQAKLMTSIHARVPHHLRDLALAARRRGQEDSWHGILEEPLHSCVDEGTCSSSVVIVTGKTQNIKSNQKQPPGEANSPRKGCDVAIDTCAFQQQEDLKENDCTLSPDRAPITAQAYTSLIKRPLSDISTDILSEDGGMAILPEISPVINRSKEATQSEPSTKRVCPAEEWEERHHLKPNIQLAERPSYIHMMKDTPPGGKRHASIKTRVGIRRL